MTAGPRRTSYGQQRLWFADQLGRQGLEYVYPYVLRLRGELDLGLLDGALRRVIDRHESLRTTYGLIDDEPFQWVHDSADVPLGVHELTGGLPATGLPEPVQAALEQPFDLTTGPLLRASVHRVAPTDHLLAVVVHHIATDGWSMDVFFRDLAEFYNAARSGRDPDLPALTMQYADFADWQREQAESGRIAEELAYWREQLGDAPLVADLPTDRPRPESQSYRGAVVTCAVPGADVAALTATASSLGASPFMAVLGVLQLTLARWARRTDLVLGTPLAHRPLRETEDLVGFFVNLLPFRLRTDEAATFRELLRATRDVALDAFDHQTVTFDRLVGELAPARTLSHNPIIQVTLTDETSRPVVLDGLEVEPLHARLDITRYDLAFDYRFAGDGGLAIDLYYAVDLFDRSTVEALAELFVRTLATSAAEPDRPLRELPLAAAPEVAGPPRPAPVIVPGLAATAARDPGRLAVAAGERSLSFAELDAEAGRIAAGLRERGVRPGRLVGVSLPRGTDLLVALAAVWRAGAAYVPLDPAYPADRLATMLGDSGAMLLITEGDTRPRWCGPVEVATLDELRRGAPPGSAAPAAPDAGDLAYVIYTSGSTGQPKGVRVTHGAVAALLDGLAVAGHLRAGPGRVGWNASVSFDASVQQWARVFRGDSIVVLTEDERSDAEALAAVVRRWELTDLDVTPSHLALLVDLLPAAAGARPADAPRLRLLVGGEPIPPALWSVLAGQAAEGMLDAVNVYGPTECAVDALAAPVTGTVPHLGAPLPGFRAYVLDRWLRPVPPGTIGELFLGGPQLAQGYHGRPEATAARFLSDPFAGGDARMYRTGDLVRRTGDRLEFRGREDGQVKVRGYRIELGDVENAIASAPGVDGAVAAALPDGSALVAGYTSAAGVPAEEVRAHVARLVPGFMVPSRWHRLERPARTVNGKADRRALLALADVPAVTEAAADDLSGPIEHLIATVWSEVLEVPAVGPHDNFFGLGGHSLLAIRLVARVKQKLSLRMPIAAVFEHATLRDLASHIEALIRAELTRRTGPGQVRG